MHRYRFNESDVLHLSLHASITPTFRLHICLCDSCAQAEADNLDKTAQKAEEYQDNHPRMRDSKEIKLVLDLIAAYNARDEQQFVGALHKYDSIYRLDSWSQALLYKVKKVVAGDGPAVKVGADGVEKTASETVDLA